MSAAPKTEAKALSKSDTPLISIVDDDASVRDATSNLLQSVGFRTQAFATAEQFCSSGGIEDSACLILDIRLPGMSGLELQQYLAVAQPQIPVIFISAHCDEEGQARALRMGALVLLCKPFSQEALLNHVRHALQLQAHRQRSAIACDEL